MRVRFKNTWFAPGQVRVLNPIFTTSGKRHDKGVHDIDEEYRGSLPSSAEILDDDFVAPVAEKVAEVQLTDYDLDRQNNDVLAAVIEDSSK